MASWLVYVLNSRTTGLGSNPGLEVRDIVLFSPGKTLNRASLHLGVQMGTGTFDARAGGIYWMEC